MTGKPSNRIPPPVIPEADWDVLDLPFNIGSGRTFYAGLEQDHRLRMRFFRRRSDHHLIGRVWFGEGSEGPPGHAHGGVIAYVLDEAMGSAAWMNSFPSVAAQLQFQYAQMTPMEQDLVVESWVEKESGKRIEIRSRLYLPNGEISVEGIGQFAVLSRSRMQELVRLFKGQEERIAKMKLKWADED